MNKQIYLSVVIPLYNEEKRIIKTLPEVKKFLDSKVFFYEIITVSDGSRDKTVEVVEKFKDEGFPVRIISYKNNKGKGYALKQGILAAEGMNILFTDADLSTPIEELDKFLFWIDKGYDIVIGSRKVAGAVIIKRQKPLRENMGKMFSSISNMLFAPGISDFTCGFKLFKHDVAKKIFEKQKIKRWGFDTEVLFLSQKYGYTIKEVPVQWINDEATKVNLIKDTVRSLGDIFYIHWNNCFGKYDKS